MDRWTDGEPVLLAQGRGGESKRGPQSAGRQIRGKCVPSFGDSEHKGMPPLLEVVGCELGSNQS